MAQDRVLHQLNTDKRQIDFFQFVYKLLHKVIIVNLMSIINASHDARYNVVGCCY